MVKVSVIKVLLSTLMTETLIVKYFRFIYSFRFLISLQKFREIRMVWRAYKQVKDRGYQFLFQNKKLSLGI
jgi:hypothetical protein